MDERNALNKKTTYCTFQMAKDFKYAKEIRIYHMADSIRNRLNALFALSEKENKKLESASIVASMVSFLLVLLRDGVAYAFLIHKAVQGEVDASSFVLYFSAITAMSGLMGGILDTFNRVFEGALQISDCREALEFPDRHNRGKGIPIPSNPFSIEFKNVSYKYPLGEKKVLDNISFRIEPGEKIALVGLNGAGKTTLTEKLLLFGGAIHVAGAVKSNKIKKGATSDFMEIERQRGISVATSVMGFNYKDVKINILDTPGHEDFAEDTYRTLTAVDSVIIVIDGAKGVEAQTRKLMNVCRMRNTPVMVFINKLDRPCKDPFDLLDEVERELQIRVRPLAFPISSGDTFKGVYNIYEKNLSLFTSDERQTADAETVDFSDITSPELDTYITQQYANQLRENLDLVEAVYDDFDREAYLEGKLAPVFFGSAVNNFGVRELLECFIRIAPSPRPSTTETRAVEADEPKMTGFVFKIHANMDPNHRDRIAFMKICSGTFERNKNYLHVRSGKQLKFSSPTAFMAEKKSVIDFAYPGDIVGLHDTGTFKIGDTFTEGEKLKFTGIPSFSPELFRYIENADPMKFKQLAKGVDQLMDEGVAQLFTSSLNGRKIIGTVGQLQFEVIQYRLEHEYGAKCRWEPISIYKACWIESDNAEQLADFKRRKHSNMAVDKHGRDVFLADTSYALALAQENFKDIRFYFTSEF